MIDCFVFFNELDLLEIRLHTLAPYVERFVLCESVITHSGHPKPLYFQENKDRFKDFNITHLIADGGMTPNTYINDTPAWRRERYHKEFLMNGIDDVDPNTTILTSDLDEIPDLEPYHVEGMEGRFRQQMYYYYVNMYSGFSWWYGTFAIQRGKLERREKLGGGCLPDREWPITIGQIAVGKRRRPALRPADDPGGKGWHFSTLGSLEQIQHKFQSGAHTELSNDDHINRLAELRQNMRDPYRSGWGRNSRVCQISMPSGPKYLLDNRDKFRHFFYEPPAE